jgi:hypothetical protein
LTLWLQALSRDEIAKEVGIGAGTVSEIIKGYKQLDSEFDLAREFVVAIKRQGTNINQFASSIRVQRVLERHDLVGGQIELLVAVAAKYCFQKGIDTKKFVEHIHEVCILAEKSGIDLEKLPAHIQEKERELYVVTMDLFSKKAESEEALRKCDETKVLLEELRKNLRKAKSRQAIRNLRESEALENDSLLRALAYYIKEWTREKNARAVLAYELGEANKSRYEHS